MTDVLKCAILHNGFITPTISDVIKEDNTSTLDTISLYGVGKSITLEKEYYYSSALKELIQTTTSNDNYLSSIDGKEQLLKIAKTLFNSYNNSIFNWFGLQVEGPYFTTLHKRFLLQSLLFAFTGERKEDFSTWDILIKPQRKTSEDDKEPFDYSGLYQKIKNNKNGVVCSVQLTRQTNYDMGYRYTDEDTYFVLANWVNQLNGYSDLYTTLKIIFSTH